ncbi:hypothetical protein MJK71_21645 [Escherichia coli]|nr:hypothetical protein MJK71_21645 [Escherichia coli]
MGEVHAFPLVALEDAEFATGNDWRQRDNDASGAVATVMTGRSQSTPDDELNGLSANGA